MQYPVVIHKDVESAYGVSVPDLPGCFSAGDTLEEAVESAQEAIACHLEGLLMDRRSPFLPSNRWKHTRRVMITSLGFGHSSTLISPSC